MRFCFMAIVKNEGPTIQRCLESVRNLADSYMICDTGSTDNTVTKIEEYMKEAGIPGEVIQKEWQSYGFNRSYLMWKLQNHPVYGKTRYIFWLDADEVYLTNKDDPTSYPTKADANQLFKRLESRPEPVFMAMTYYGRLKYPRWQFARNNQKYLWRLPYQEYFKAAQDERCHILEGGIYNLARHEGNSSRDPKIIQKRIDMTEKWLKLGLGSYVKDESGFTWPGPQEEDVPRIYFYLGEAYKHVDKKISLFYYKKRLTMGGFEQEKYVTMVDLSKMVDNDYERLAYLFQALSICPNRLEAPFYLMGHYQQKGEYRKAAALGSLASELRTPDPQALFTEYDIYTYLFDFNYSICCGHGGQEQIAYKIGKRLFEEKKYPPDLEEKVKGNLEFFFSKLPRNTLELPSNFRTEIKLRPEFPELMVIDGFYEDIDEIRQTALQQSYEIVPGYPGKKSLGLGADQIKRTFEKILQEEITYWPETNGQFQYLTKKGANRITRSSSDYTVVIFLLPNAPSEKGVFFYRHKATGSEDGPEKDFHDESKWEVIDRVANKYNRAVLFRGNRVHKYEQSLGNSLETGLLVQVFHFSF